VCVVPGAARQLACLLPISSNTINHLHQFGVGFTVWCVPQQQKLNLPPVTTTTKSELIPTTLNADHPQPLYCNRCNRRYLRPYGVRHSMPVLVISTRGHGGCREGMCRGRWTSLGRATCSCCQCQAVWYSPVLTEWLVSQQYGLRLQQRKLLCVRICLVALCCLPCSGRKGCGPFQ
jgi:hypothetical protein